MKKLNKTLLAENIEARLHDDLSACRVSGVALRVCQEGETVYENTFGTVSPDRHEPMRYDTLFRLASMTKPITGVAAMLLCERGLLALDAPITEYLPELADRKLVRLHPETKELEILGNVKEPMRLRHLLSHSSGFGCGACLTHYQQSFDYDKNDTLEKILPIYATMGVSFEPGTAQEYSGTVAFDLIATAIQRVTGKDYNDFLTEEIFVPLGMKDTTFLPSEEQKKRLTVMHNLSEGNSVPCYFKEGTIFGNIPVTHYLGGAGLVSTLNDYTRFAEMLLHGGALGNTRILKEESIAAMRTPQLSREIMPWNWNWGLSMRVIVGGHPVLPQGTFGWSGAYGTHFIVDPVNHITAVYLKNSAYDGGAGATTANHFEEDIYQAVKEELPQ